ncbi:ShlB/FhaC/HecB family hemolysin secretion/activation protein [Metallibacterium sp.]|uniref:ShlB/FhaC/HecB family hemolysin secretion/activation protein n=1 Tax=Metallibacterium sp. TaxID=2940281 RepID=UPI00262FB73E|nr:ShlB/FhaC/HecB family hemolysin secretion/activation protein [Metallibacterium sp.]
MDNFKECVVRIALLSAALALALCGGSVWAQDAAGIPLQILVSGVSPAHGVATPASHATVERIVDTEYRAALVAAGHPPALTPAQLQIVAENVTRALHKAGFAHARAFLSNQMLAFNVPNSAAVSVSALASASPQHAVTPPAPLAPNVVPPMSVRDERVARTDLIAVRGFHVEGVGNHADAGITPTSIQTLADTLYTKLGGTAEQPVKLSFLQLQGVADAITNRYRKAGFIVATAFLPAQTLGSSKIVDIKVLEGRIGRVIVEGAKRYRPWVIAAPAERLKGHALRKSDVDSALLYDRDLPGVSVAATFEPGAQVGQTNLLLIAHEAPHPYTFTVGADNYGTSITGRYRALLGATWNSPLGIGDRLAANIDYALDPSQNVYGSLLYTVPTVIVPGLNGVVGATRSTLQINTGPFSALHISGPTSSYFGGVNWKFVNDEDLKLQASLQLIHEQAKISSLGVLLSDEQFNVLDLGFGMNQTDRRFHGVNLLQVDLRQSVSGHSLQPDLISPNHANKFTIGRLSYTRLQFLPDNQQLYFKLVGQYTHYALPPLEQFSIGGPYSVRAYPIATALTDSGFYTSLEYHVAAPGFGNLTSPFYGQPWRSLLELETFVDYARGYPSAGDRLGNPAVVTYKGIGAGVVFRLPRFHGLEFHLDYSVPVDEQSASGLNGYQIYSGLGMKF